MNLGVITKPNSKGQIVIPKKLRDELGIDENVILTVSQIGRGVYISPISRGAVSKDSRELMLKIVRSTAGAWGPASPEEKKRAKEQRKIELAASKRRKNQW